MSLEALDSAIYNKFDSCELLFCADMLRKQQKSFVLWFFAFFRHIMPVMQTKDVFKDLKPLQHPHI